VLWEIGEYAVILADLSATENPYEDTIGDFVFGLVGSALGSTFALYAVYAAEEEERAALGEEATRPRAAG
jgi:hypothetical protein